MPVEQNTVKAEVDALDELFAELSGPGAPPSGGGRKWRATRWVVLAVALTLIGLSVTAFPGVWAQLRSSGNWPFSNATLRVEAELKAIPGIAGVSDPETRAGDLTFRDNVFFTVTGNDGLSSGETDELADAISTTLASAQGHTRFMVELDLGQMSVGISPNADLNPARLALVRSLAEAEGVVRATVLWASQDDDLIFDESNKGLDVWIQASDGQTFALVDQVRPLLSVAESPKLTAVILGSNPPRERVYSWSGDASIERGERQLTIRLENSGSE